MPSTEPDSIAARRIHVAVGVIVDSHQQILIALRPDDAHQGGLWEFPGGKVEQRETVEQALQRELLEELGLTIRSCRPMLQVSHDYGDKSVLLDVWWVEQFQGEPVGREGQPIRWVAPHSLAEFSFPAANRPIVEAVIRSFATSPESI